MSSGSETVASVVKSGFSNRLYEFVFFRLVPGCQMNFISEHHRKSVEVEDEERQNALGDGMTPRRQFPRFLGRIAPKRYEIERYRFEGHRNKISQKTKLETWPSKAKKGASLRRLLLTRKMPVCPL